MTALLLDPHGDDAALFAAYTCFIHEPLVAVTHATAPEDEMEEAFDALNVDWCLGLPIRPDWEPSVVFAPAWHEDGHEEHNEVSALAKNWDAPVFYYTTYAPRGQRQKGKIEIQVDGGIAVARKLRALSCFVSQIEQESTRPWFTTLLDLREWLA